MTLIESIPTFSGSASLEEFRAAYDSVQCVYFRKVNVRNSPEDWDNKNASQKKNTKKRKHTSTQSDRHNLALQTVLSVFHSATPKDQSSWCIETDEADQDDDTSTTSTRLYPSAFFSPTSTQQGYCSFILQDDSDGAISQFTAQHVPHPTLPLTPWQPGVGVNKSCGNDDGGATPSIPDDSSVLISNPYWIFVGRNTNGPSSSSNHKALQGRNEHTDNIQHDGTFHYQWSGSKRWKIRPTQELRDACDERDVALSDSYTVTVEEGDIFVLNTRLWWHQTEIPPAAPTTTTTDKNINSNSPCTSNLSISYARDIYLDGKQPHTNNVGEEEEEHMSIEYGAWAVAFIPKGMVLLTDTADPPLMRRTKCLSRANCRLIVADDGDANNDSHSDSHNEQPQPPQMALVAIKDIQEAEFFTLLDDESDDDGIY